MPLNVGTQSAKLNFEPENLTVAAGTTITFLDNDTVAPHNVTWETMPAGATLANSPITMSQGQTFTVTLTVPGTYTYHCSLHPAWMQGTIVVTG